MIRWSSTKYHLFYYFEGMREEDEGVESDIEHGEERVDCG